MITLEKTADLLFKSYKYKLKQSWYQTQCLIKFKILFWQQWFLKLRLLYQFPLEIWVCSVLRHKYIQCAVLPTEITNCYWTCKKTWQRCRVLDVGNSDIDKRFLNLGKNVTRVLWGYGNWKLLQFHGILFLFSEGSSLIV